MCLILAGCTVNSLPGKGAGEVTIKRDSYGVPHIYAEDNFGVFYGYGYAVAQDRLFQMEMTKRTVTGTAAEVLGADFVEVDKQVRQGFDPDSIRRQMAALSEEHRDVLEGYAAGYNSWLAEVNKRPEKLMPKEFLDYGFMPSRLTAYEVAMIFAGSMAHRYADFNEELNNLAFYQNLRTRYTDDEAWKIVNTVQPLYDSDSPTTVPDDSSLQSGNRQNPTNPPSYLTDRDINPPVRLAMDASGGHLAIASDEERSAYLNKHYALSGNSGTAGFPTTSNVWLVNKHKARDAKAVLVNGPQFGWINPSYVYGVGLHGADWDVVGNTMLAYPAVLFAHNNSIGWGSTAGYGDQVDIFELQLNPENPDQYLYQGSYRFFERRDEQIPVKGQQPTSVTFYRSVHGPVILHDSAKGVAFSKKRAWEDHELETMMAWVDMPKAKNFSQWRNYVARIAININFYYIDSEGNIGYTHGGKYPLRHAQHDSRFPAKGDGSMDWQGWLPFESNPYVYNPEQGYIQNWNNRPARGWRAIDMWWKNWGRVDRADTIIDELVARQSLTAEQVWDINSRTSYADVNVAYLLPYLTDALAGAKQSALTSAGLAELQGWDKYWWDKDADGYFDSAGPAIMEAWLKRLLARVFADDIGDKFFFRFASPGYPTGRITGAVGASPGTKALVRILDQHRNGEISGFDFFNGQDPAQLLVETFTAALAQLQTEHGTDIAAWRVKPHPLVFGVNNFRGVRQTTVDNEMSLPVVMNRGTENNLFIARGSHIEGSDVAPPGQSGFIAPDGSRSPHYADQMELYQRFEHKPLPFSRAQVEQMTEAAVTLRYAR
nr:penicillin acylase family protein [Pseudomaricurvus alcaniphilus]